MHKGKVRNSKIKRIDTQLGAKVIIRKPGTLRAKLIKYNFFTFFARSIIQPVGIPKIKLSRETALSINPRSSAVAPKRLIYIAL